MKLKELKNKWGKEKDSYKTHEVGSGVQIYIKDMLQSEELFSLKRGLKSTKLEKRKNEFLEEESTKEGRKADIIIYISSDIIIPIEIERFQNIEAGKKQIIAYQADLEKKYGILTDGYTWRFYNNNIYRSFTLTQMLDNPSLFLTFWEDYIKAEHYYLSFFEPQGQLSLLKEQEILGVDENRQVFFNNITHLIKSFSNKLQIEGYFKDLDKKDREKKAIEITYAYIIQFVLYKTLVDNEYDNFAQEFKDIVKAIHECLKVEQYGKILGIIEGISEDISKNIYKPFKNEQAYIDQHLHDLIRKPKNELHEVAPWLDIFVFIKKYCFANIQNDIFGYIYENYLKDLFEDTNKGQYFTDPAVVRFMLDEMGYTGDIIKKKHQKDEINTLSIIDPSCGSGTFLYSVVDRLILSLYDKSTLEKSKLIEETINNEIFGLDIAEFPLYLAEMNILMRMLPLIINEKYNNPIDKKIKLFKTNDSIAEFKDTIFRSQEKKTAQAMLFSPETLKTSFVTSKDSFLRDEKDLKEMKTSLIPPRRRFDYVIGNPPYIGYNECCKQEIAFTKLIKEKTFSMGDAYGVNLNTVPNRIKPYSPKPNLYAFFIALGLHLLKDDGKLCYIIPQTILTANDLDVLRYHLSKKTTIEKIITFEGKMFIGRGLKQKEPIPTSSLIFVVSKKEPSKGHKVTIVNYQNNEASDFEQYLKSRKKETRTISQIELFNRLENWNFIKFDSSYQTLIKKYNTSLTIDEFRNSLASYDTIVFDKGLVFDKSHLTFDKDDWQTIKNNKTGYKIALSGRYINSKHIRLPEGSRGLSIFNNTYKIVWSYMNFDKFYFSDDKIMIDFNWVIISSNDKKEMLFLHSLLNSVVNKSVLTTLLGNSNEQAILLGIRVIKEFVRIPRINKANDRIKNEIIKQAEQLLAMEDKTLEDYVDFKGVSMQKFDTLSTDKHNLFLSNGDLKIPVKIKTNHELVKQYVDNKCFPLASGEQGKISLSTIKSFPVIDSQKQRQLKEYIDDLVFALYFDIDLTSLGIEKAKKVKSKCLKSPLYKTVNKINKE